VKLIWSLPIRGERLDSSRGDLVRARSMIQALRLDGHDVRVVEAEAAPGAAAATAAYRRGVRRLLPRRAALVLRDLGRAVHGWAHGGRVAAAARAHGAALIVETQVHFSVSGARAAKRAGLPLLLDDCSPLHEEATLGAGLNALGQALFTRQLAAAASVVVSSAELAAHLERDGARRDRIRIVANGIDSDAHAPSRVDRGAARAALGVEDECVAAFVGSFQPWHQTELLVRALAAVAKPARFRVVLVGEGPGLLPTLRLAEELGVADHVDAVGPVPSSAVPALLAACDVGVLPGTNDYGQPMKLLEYAAAGLPSIAPDLPPVRACVLPDRTGLLFPPADPLSLARALERLGGDPALRRELGDAARERVLRDASWANRSRVLISEPTLRSVEDP
jgi:glycosyltransferase involved in cell wall biosynthesis